MSFKTYSHGQILMKENTAGQDIFLIRSGVLQASVDKAEIQKPIFRLGQG